MQDKYNVYKMLHRQYIFLSILLTNLIPPVSHTCLNLARFIPACQFSFSTKQTRKNKKNEVVIHSPFFTMYHSIYNSIIPDIMHPPEAPFCFNSPHCFSSNLIPPIAYTGTFTVLQTSFKNPSPLGARPFLQSVT